VVKIIAVGNPAYGDDGIGAAVLEALRSDGLEPGVELIDVQTDALAMIDHFTADGTHVIIDAAGMGETPGSVVRFTPDEVRLRINWDHLSMHGFGLAETFALAASIGEMPVKVVIIGVEPEIVEFDRGLSAAVAAAIPEIVSLIQTEVRGHVETNHPGR